MFTFLTNFCCSKQAVANRIFEKKFSLPTTQNVGNIKYLWSLDWKMGFFALTIFFFSKFVSLKIVSLKTSFQWIIILLSMAIQKRPICHEVNISFLFNRDLIRFLLKCVLIHGKIFLWYSYIWHTFPIIVTFGVKCDFFIKLPVFRISFFKFMILDSSVLLSAFCVIFLNRPSVFGIYFSNSLSLSFQYYNVGTNWDNFQPLAQKIKWSILKKLLIFFKNNFFSYLENGTF